MNRCFQFISTAAFVAAAAVGLIAVVNSRRAIAFSEVQQAARKVESYSYSRSVGSISERVKVLDEFHSRREMGDAVTIFDWKRRRALELDTKRRTARLLTLYPTPEKLAEHRDALKQLKTAPQRASKKLSERKIDGRRVVEYLVKDGRGEQVISVDVQSKLPVRSEWRQRKGAPRGVRVIYGDYRFDEKLDPSAFRIVPPGGYKVVERTEPQGKVPGDGELRKLVLSDRGIGTARFGMTKGDIVRALGKPDGIVSAKTTIAIQGPGKIVTHKELPAEKLLYNSRGFHLLVSLKFGLESVECFGPPRSGLFERAFLGKTDNGVRMGAAPDDVVKAYGRPNLDGPPNFGEQFFGYVIAGPPATITRTFRSRDGRVYLMVIGRRPGPPVEPGDAPGT